MTSKGLYKIVNKAKPNIFTDKIASVDRAIKWYVNGPNMVTSIHCELFPLANALSNDGVPKKILDVLSEYNVNLESVDIAGEEGRKIASYLMSNAGNLYPRFVIKAELPSFLKSIYTCVMNETNNKNQALKACEEVIRVIKNTNTYKQEGVDVGSYNETKYIYPGRDLRRYIKELEEWLVDMQDEEFMNILNTFIQLRKDAQCTTTLSNRLGINQGMKVDVYGQYKYNENLTNYYWNLYHETKSPSFSSRIRSHMVKYGMHSMFQALDVKQATSDNVAQREEYLAIIRDLEADRETKYHILDIEGEHPSFGAMIETQNFAIKMFSKAIVRYDSILKIAEMIRLDLDKKFGNIHLYEDREFGVISNFIVNSMIQSFIKDKGYKATMKKDDYIYASRRDGLVRRRAEDGYVIDLTTPEGRMNFAHALYSKMDQYKSQYKDNAFIQSLTSDSRVDSLTNRKYTYAKLDMTMNNIKTSYATNKLQKIINDFEKLKSMPSMFNLVDAKGNKLTMADEFMLYNMIIHQNAFGDTSMTKVFENSLNDGSNNNNPNPIYEFMKYVGDIDFDNTKNGNSYVDELDLELVKMSLATIRTKYDPKDRYMGQYIKALDPDTKLFTIMKLKDGVVFNKKGRPERINPDGSKTGFPLLKPDGKTPAETLDVYEPINMNNEIPLIFANSGVKGLGIDYNKTYDNTKQERYKQMLLNYSTGKFYIDINC